MGTKPLPVLWAFSHSKQEINDSNDPFGSDSCLNGIPPSAAKGGELGREVVPSDPFTVDPGWNWIKAYPALFVLLRASVC